MNKKSGRFYVQIYNKVTQKRTTRQYARYLYELHHNIKLPKCIHVHHIDLNPHNNSITNLEAVYKDKHLKENGLNNRNYSEEKDFICQNCNISFILTRQQQIERNATLRDGGEHGPFCSKKCCSVYNNLHGKKGKHVRENLENIKKELANGCPVWKISCKYKVGMSTIHKIKNKTYKY